MSNREQSILERISESRKPIEPEAGQLEVVQDEELPGQESEPVEDIEYQEAEPEEALEEVEEELFFDLRGREISEKQINEWEQGNLRQSDYTRKTQAIAEERKALESEKDSIKSRASNLDESIARLNTLIEENQEEIDWDDLREYNPSEYLKQKELQDKRKQALKDAKSVKQALSDEDKKELFKREQSVLLKNNPEWVENGKTTEAYQKDISMVNDYFINHGYSQEEQSEIVSAKHWQAVINSAKYEASKAKTASTAKKVRKVPIVTKPTSARRASVSAIDKARANHKKHGTIQTAMALKKAQQQTKGN